MLSSRLLTAVTNLQSAFDEARGYAKYHPSRGYWWDFDEGKTKSGKLNKKPKGDQQGGSKGEGKSKTKKSKKKKEAEVDQASHGLNAASSMFQRRRVDMLLDVWARKFPPAVATQSAVTGLVNLSLLLMLNQAFFPPRHSGKSLFFRKLLWPLLFFLG